MPKNKPSSTTMEQVLAQFRAYIEDMQPTRAFLLEFATSSMENPATVQIGYAILKHAQDVMADTPAVTETELVIEAYRRTLFDRTHAETYGTEHMVGSPEQCLMMIEGMQQMTAAEARGSSMHSEPCALQ
jgi:hypothetical protein